MSKDDDCNKRLQIVVSSQVSNDTFQTFVLLDEEHTLGNSVRYMINKNPEVTFCGYSVPHPSESKINLRIQTKGVPPIDVLRTGLVDLKTASQHILNTFERAVELYEEQHTATTRRQTREDDIINRHEQPMDE